LVCFDKFKQPRKKLDGAIDIPYCLDDLSTFGQIEEEILTRKLPTEWGKIDLGFICYQKSTSTKADHYDLKSNGGIAAFVAECKKKRISNYVYILQNKLRESKLFVEVL
jgi:hypothetical protein